MKPNYILMNIINHSNYPENNKKQQKNIKNKKPNKNKNRNITYTEGFLKIATHNVRGFNNETKQKIFRTFYKENKIDIIGITETKLNKNNGKICMNNIESYKLGGKVLIIIPWVRDMLRIWSIRISGEPSEI